MHAVATLALLAAVASAPPGGAKEDGSGAGAKSRELGDTPHAGASAGVRIDWSGPPECAGAGPLRRRLDVLLAGAPPESPPTGEVRVRLRRSAAGVGRYAMDLEVRSTAGAWRRSLDGEACAVLIAAAALIAAINLDPLTTSATVTASLADAAAKGAAAAPSPVVDVGDVGDVGDDVGVSVPSRPTLAAGASPEDQPIGDARRDAVLPEAGDALADPAPRRRLGFAARAGAGAIYGPTPRLGALLLAGVGLSIGPRAQIEVAAIHRIEERSPVAGAPMVELVSALTGARVDACGLLRRGSLEAPLCAGFDLAALRAEAIGLARSVPSRALHAALIVDARVLWRPAPSIGLGLDLGGGISLTRWAYRIGDLAAPVLTTTPALGHVGLSVELRLP